MIEENKIITMLNIDLLHPHPDNPRREVGDVSELADSIRENGIMQNLTVIPNTEGFRIPGAADWEEEYTVLIGHRRLAAAKQAGIRKLPCVIVEGIPRAQQIMIMNGENSQRHDLTKYEEGASYQLMLDLGETVDSIAKGVGFSEKTIKNRLGLARLDEDVLNSKSFQLTIEAIEALNKIENTEDANKIIKEATSAKDILWRAENCVKKRAEKEFAGKIEEILRGKGFRRMSNEKYQAKRWNLIDTVRSLSIGEDAFEELDTVKYQPGMMYVYDESLYGNGMIRLIKPKEEDQEEKKAERAAEQKRKEVTQNRKKLEAMKTEMSNAFKSYAAHILDHWVRPQCKEDAMIARLWREMVRSDVTINTCRAKSVLQSVERMKDYTEEDIQDIPMMYCMLLLLMESSWREVVDYNGYYDRKKADTYMEKYRILQEFGFAMPDPEWLKLLDGTHELYRKKEENGI